MDATTKAKLDAKLKSEEATAMAHYAEMVALESGSGPQHERDERKWWRETARQALSSPDAVANLIDIEQHALAEMEAELAMMTRQVNARRTRVKRLASAGSLAVRFVEFRDAIAEFLSEEES